MRWQACEPPSLGAHDVHVWRISIPHVNGDTVLVELSSDERERAARFVVDRARREFVAARGMLRRILARYLGVPAKSLLFTAGDCGKPALVGFALEFNLSHSGDFALLAIARRPVGIDVECWRTGVEYAELARRFFSSHERTALRSLEHEPGLAQQGFYAAWARKEAYIKATGIGITQGLDHFDVSLMPDSPPALLDDRRDAGARDRYVLRELEVSPGYSAAVVCHAPLEALLLFDSQLP